MIDLYLRAKHWQLFILFFALPMLLYIFGFSHFFTNMMSATYAGISPEEHIFEMFAFFKYIPMFALIVMMILQGWFWSLTNGLQDKVPQEAKFNLTRFKIFLLFPIVYISFLSYFMYTFFDAIPQTTNEIGEQIENLHASNPFLEYLRYIPLVVLLHFFAMFCMFHTIYFTAKTVKSVELNRKVKFDDFIGEFFLLWFNFIGVWIIQPKVNSFVEKQAHSNHL